MNNPVSRIFQAALLIVGTCPVAAFAAPRVEMATRLLQENAATRPGGNVCLSPFSLQMAMAVAVNGAGGNTRREILQTMGWVGLSTEEVNFRMQSVIETLTHSEGITVETANSIWINKKVASPRRSFIKACRSYLGAEVSRLPFNVDAAAKINKWCADHTADRIPTIIDTVDPAAELYLLNALYFKGAWVNPFNAALTAPRPFHIAAGSPVQAPMMTQQSYYAYAETTTCQAVEMPFVSIGRQKYSLYVLLPKPGTTADALLETLPVQWESVTEALSSEDVRLTLPKFKMEYSTALNGTLMKMGIHDAFQPGRAHFDAMSKTPLYLNLVLQKTFIEVSEEGVEAAAVTAIAMTRSAAPRPHDVKVMTVDRPFLYLLVEKSSGTLLFVGKVENPVG